MLRPVLIPFLMSILVMDDRILAHYVAHQMRSLRFRRRRDQVRRAIVILAISAALEVVAGRFVTIMILSGALALFPHLHLIKPAPLGVLLRASIAR